MAETLVSPELVKAERAAVQGEVVTAGRPAGGRTFSPRDLACHALFLLLLAFAIARTLGHAMWRDELQIFQLGTASRSIVELFHRLRYEAHAGLWDSLVFLVTRITSDPVWMQVLHAALAASVWLLIYRLAPFSRVEKFLALLSYYLFFEYFAISRSYVLAALLGFGFAALRQHAPRRTVLAWLLLGLLANLVAQGTIWSIALAIVFALETRARDRAFRAGLALYLVLLAFAIWTMIPAPDYGPWGSDVGLSLQRLYNAVTIPIGAFLPFDPARLSGYLAGSGEIASGYWNSNPTQFIVSVLDANLQHPLRLMLVFAAPLVLCWLVTRERWRLLEFALAYGGMLVFATRWAFPGTAHHHGVLLLAFLASAWLARAARPPDRWSVWTLRLVLLANAIGGIASLAAETHPFSQSRNASQWLVANGLAGDFLIGSRDAQVSSVAGYLGRPVYYLECECQGTFITWNHDRQSPLSSTQFQERLSRALDVAAGPPAILISNRQLGAGEVPGVSATLLQSFTGAETDENYWIYRVSRPQT